MSIPWIMIWLTVSNGAASAWFGYDQGLWSGINSGEPFNKRFPANRHDSTQGILGSCFALGNFVACCLVGWAGGKLGRRKTVLLGSTIAAIGVVLQAAAYSLPQLFVGRIINGFGNGMTSSTCSMYQSECAKGNMRGRLVLSISCCTIAFYCIANWVTYGTNFSNNDLQWRVPIAIQIIFLLPIYAIVPWLPESPRWLLSVNRPQAALESTSRLLGKAKSDSDVLYEFDSMTKAVELEHEASIRFSDVIMCRDNVGNLHRILLGCGIQFMQQFTGINALNYYLDELLERVLGLSSNTARLIAGVNASQYFVFSVVAFLLIDSLGRRKLMMGGATVQAIAYTGVGVCVALVDRAPRALGILGTAFLFVYYAAFGLAWTPLPWIYSAEINSYGLRTAGTAAATATNWISSFIVVQFTPSAIRNLRWGFFILFAGFNFIFVLIAWAFYPETANRTLEDLDEYFHADAKVFCGRTAVATGSKRPRLFIEREKARVRAAAAARSDRIDREQNERSDTVLGAREKGTRFDKEEVEQREFVDS